MKVTEVTDGRNWNDFLQEAGGTVLQSYEWGELKNAFSWQPYRLAVREGRETVAAISLLKRGIPGIRGRSLFYAPQGPVLKKWSPEILGCLMEAVEELAEREKAVFLRIDPPVREDDREKTRLLTDQGFRAIPDNFQPRHTLVVDLGLPEEELLMSFKEKHRYNIRLARKKGVEVSLVSGTAGVERFFRLLEQTQKRQNFNIRSLAYYQKVREILESRGMMQVFLATYKGEDLAAVFILKFGQLIWYMYGASSDSGRNLMPNYLLHWEVMRWAKSTGCAAYDLWGIPQNPERGQPLWGAYRFKNGFAGEQISWAGCFDRPFKRVTYQAIKSGLKIYRGYRNLLTRGQWRSVLGEGT